MSNACVTNLALERVRQNPADEGFCTKRISRFALVASPMDGASESFSRSKNREPPSVESMWSRRASAAYEGRTGVIPYTRYERWGFFCKRKWKGFRM